MRGKPGYKYTTCGGAGVADTEEAKAGVAKFTIDCPTMGSQGGRKATACAAMANHQGGGMWADSPGGNGIQGNKYWLLARVAKDKDNSGANDVVAQVISDHEPAIVDVQG